MLTDFIKETISAGGTGNLTLSGAVSGFISWNTAFSTSREFYYCIEDGTSREIGQGHLTTSTNFVRDKVLGTLVSGTWDFTAPAAINATTAALVFSGGSSLSMPFNLPFPNNQVGSTATALIPANIAGSNTAVGSAAPNRVMFWYVFVQSSMELASISFYVETSAASCNSEFGLYDIQSNGQGGKLIATTGAVSVTTTGFKTGSVTHIWLPAGWYIAACVSDHASNNPNFTFANGCWGSGAGVSANINYLRWRSDTSATSLAATALSTSLVEESAAACPKIWLTPT
jgi:hypothetical protein